MTMGFSGMLNSGTKIKYLRNMVHVEVLRKFDMLSAEVRSAFPENLTTIILGLGPFFSVDALSKIKCAMRRRTSKPPSLKIRYHGAGLIDVTQ